MVKSKIILDSSSYFRLAKSKHPLLNRPFGKDNFCLFITKEIQMEYDSSKRLQNKFNWVNELEYIENRKRIIHLSKKDKIEIDYSITIVASLADKITSLTDIKFIAVAQVLNVPIVTDDKDIIDLAKLFDVSTITTLEVLRLMLDSNHIEIEEIRAAVQYWMYIDDLPRDFRKDYKELFNEEPPKPT